MDVYTLYFVSASVQDRKKVLLDYCCETASEFVHMLTYVFCLFL